MFSYVTINSDTHIQYMYEYVFPRTQVKHVPKELHLPQQNISYEC